MLRLRDIMTPKVLTMSPDFTIRDAMEFLATKRISGAPVVEDGEVIGVVSATDLIAFAASQPGARGETGSDDIEWEDDEDLENSEETDEAGTYFTDLLSDAGDAVDVRFRAGERSITTALDDHTVSEVMTEHIHSMPSTTEVGQAANYMRDARIHRLLVMDRRNLVGIVSASDIASAVADNRLTTRTYVFNRSGRFDQRT